MAIDPPLHPAALRPSAGGAQGDAAVLADALGRLLVFAAVYPPDHVRVTSLAQPLADLIASRATDDAPCVIALVQDGLLIDDETIHATTVAVRHLRRDIELLSVYQVEFFRTITASDLIDFASKVRSTTRRETSRRTFEEPCLQGLPPSIAARFNDFGTPVFGTETEGETWCGETLDLPDVEPGAEKQDVPPEDWRRLTRLLVTELLTVIDPGEDAGTAVVAPGGAASEGEAAAGAAAENAPPDAAPAAAPEGTGPAGGGKAGKARAAGTAGTGSGKGPAVLGGAGVLSADIGGSAAGARRAAAHPFAALLSRPKQPGAPGSVDRTQDASDGTAVIPGWLGDIVGPEGLGAPGAGDAAGGPGGTATTPGSGGGGSRATRSSSRKRSGPNVPGIAPEDGYRARGSRERVRAIEEAVRRAIERAIASGGEVRSVSRIVAEARRLLPSVAPELPLDQVLDGIREALDEHLRDAFRTEGGASFDAARQPAREPVRCKLELPQLLERVAAVAKHVDTRPVARTVDGPEQLSILLHILEEERRPGVADGITRRLFSRLSRALDAEETVVMAGWIDSICSPPRPIALPDRLLPLLFDQLRRAAPACTIAVLLRALHGARPPVLRALWPHVAAELLYGLDGATEDVRDQAVVLMSEVPSDMLESETERFAALVALVRGHHSTRFLDPPRRRLAALHELILGLRDAPDLAAGIVAGYRRVPPPNSAARALVAMDTEASARTFLRRVLREERDGGESESLRRMGAGIVAAALHGLTRAGRRQDWVPEAIRAFVALRSPLAIEVVEEILYTRRFLVLREWPAACRRAALAVRTYFQVEGAAGPTRAMRGEAR